MIKYLINNNETTKEEFERKLEEAVNTECEGAYDDYLDDGCEPYHFGYLTFYPSQILSQCDPIAYRCGYTDYLDTELSDALYELECGKIVEKNGDTFEQIGEEDDEEEKQEE